ncbi:hypothetical protein KGP36_05960 [Patescibacteria group bacterium]|nr:hypothetical protein [Patescibacteria group bacterium]
MTDVGISQSVYRQSYQDDSEPTGLTEARRKVANARALYEGIIIGVLLATAALIIANWRLFL